VVKAIPAISLLYDASAGLTLLFFRDILQVGFNVPPAYPPIHVDLNGIFLTFVGIGYLLPYRDPIRYRPYIWIFGVALKTAGAIAFVFDYLSRGSVGLLLLFAMSDAFIAALSLVALIRERPAA
jgi:hypothetical protein